MASAGERLTVRWDAIRREPVTIDLDATQVTVYGRASRAPRAAATGT